MTGLRHAASTGSVAAQDERHCDKPVSPCAGGFPSVLDVAELSGWVRVAGHRDRLVYCRGGWLPAKCQVARLAYQLSESDLILLHQIPPARTADGCREWVAVRTAKPLPADAAALRKAERSGESLSAEAKELLDLIARCVERRDRLPGVKHLAEALAVPRREVLPLLAELEGFGEIIVETFFGPFSQAWRVVTMTDTAERTMGPPEGWLK